MQAHCSALVSCALLLVFLMTAEVQAKAGERIYGKL